MSAPDTAAAAESARRAVDVATWVAIGLGLAFTAVNVQTFAAAGAPAWSPAWAVAWLLDPMVSVLLLAVVRAEQVTARWQITMPWPVTATKWAAFAATYAMNTWASWRDVVPSSVLLHSIPPVFVLLGAEVAPALRDRLTEAVRLAERSVATHGPLPTELPEPVVGADATPWTPLAVDRPHGPASSVAVPINAPGASAPPSSAKTPAAADTTAPEPEPGPDARIVGIAELLAAGCDVTGPQAAVLHGVSDRTGRRLLADARTHLAQHPTTGHGLHLVAPTDAGRTA